MSRRERLRDMLLDTKKALGALGVMTTTAVGFGFLDDAAAGYVLGGVAVAVAGVTYILGNETNPARSVAARSGRHRA